MRLVFKFSNLAPILFERDNHVFTCENLSFSVKIEKTIQTPFAKNGVKTVKRHHSAAVHGPGEDGHAVCDADLEYETDDWRPAPTED